MAGCGNRLRCDDTRPGPFEAVFDFRKQNCEGLLFRHERSWYAQRPLLLPAELLVLVERSIHPHCCGELTGTRISAGVAFKLLVAN